MFRISIEESSSRERWIIQGRLAGAFAGELDDAWSSSFQKNPLLSRVVDLCGVTLIDRRGEEVLRKMLSQHAEFIAPGIYTKHLLEQLRAAPKSPFPDTQSADSSRGPHTAACENKSVR
jgi:hypothetical protein